MQDAEKISQKNIRRLNVLAVDDVLTTLNAFISVVPAADSVWMRYPDKAGQSKEENIMLRALNREQASLVRARFLSMSVKRGDIGFYRHDFSGDAIVINRKTYPFSFSGYCAYRSNAQQEALYAQGRTKPGPRVTNARGGQSAHNFMLDGKPAAKAFDIVPVIHGKAMWSRAHPHWQTLGKIGMDLGLNWYGAPGSKFDEFPHFQLK